MINFSDWSLAKHPTLGHLVFSHRLHHFKWHRTTWLHKSCIFNESLHHPSPHVPSDCIREVARKFKYGVISMGSAEVWNNPLLKSVHIWKTKWWPAAIQGLPQPPTSHWSPVYTLWLYQWIVSSQFGLVFAAKKHIPAYDWYWLLQRINVVVQSNEPYMVV